MEQNKNSIEGIFQQTFAEHNVSPSPRVLRQLKRNLFISDFFSFNLRKFNVGYMTFIVVTVVAIYSSLNSDKKQSSKNINQESGPILENTLNKSANAVNPGVKLTDSDVMVSGDQTDLEKRTMSAYFEIDELKGCAPHKVHFKNKSVNAESYQWDFGTGDKSITHNPVYIFNTPGVYKVKLISGNSNGNSSEYIQTVQVYEKPHSKFDIDVKESDLDNRMVVFKNKSENAKSYIWNFGDKSISKEREPEHSYANYRAYQVSLVSISDNGCTDTISELNTFFKKDYRLVFPREFKPNPTNQNKGVYERPENEAFVFYPRNFGVQKYKLIINASNGMEVFATNNIKQGWDGYIRGRMAPAGLYKYEAQGVYPNGKDFSINGTVMLRVDKSYENYYNQ
jgi:PKD repeat protein